MHINNCFKAFCCKEKQIGMVGEKGDRQKDFFNNDINDTMFACS